jgi:hypothetical protein
LEKLRRDALWTTAWVATWLVLGVIAIRPELRIWHVLLVLAIAAGLALRSHLRSLRSLGRLTATSHGLRPGDFVEVSGWSRPYVVHRVPDESQVTVRPATWWDWLYSSLIRAAHRITP